MNKSVLLLSLPAVLALSACGGGGGGSTASTGSSTSSPLLQVGMQRQYSGSSTRSIVYTTPTSTNPNNTLAYTFTEVQNVLQAPTDALASFRINTVYTYAVTQDPGTGSVPVSQVVDDYKNLLVSGNTQWTVDYGQTTTTVNLDESANALGGGPFNATTTTVASYPTLRPGFVFPLQTGASLTMPQSAQQQISYSDVNASGSAPSNGSNVAYNTSRSQNDDGSFSFLRSYVNGNTDNYQQNADGSASFVQTTSSSTTNTGIAQPVAGASGFTIPITRTVAAASTSTKSYSAADWYPGNALPVLPLVLQQEVVVGPVSSLPTQCNGALVQPNMFEIDTTTSNLNTSSGNYSLTTTRSFNANGVAVCTLTQEAAYAYSLLTGVLNSTTTTQTTTVLTSLTN
ncbi:MAG: hypothetical protein JOY84_23210 [Curvibacter sp.]|nr:hypothetical protein [Curvibacter sp.]